MTNKHNIQVQKSHYDFLKYVDIRRFSSYFYQLETLYKLNPSSILEVGVGDGIVGGILQKTFDYKTMDFDPELHPNYVGSIAETNYNIPDSSFDCVCAFQVLEHIPYEQFPDALQELSRISKKHVVISLPYARVDCKFEFKIPLFKRRRINLSFPLFFMKHIFKGEHYREIGKKGYSKNEISKILKQHFTIVDTFNPYENTYHLFYVLQKN